MDAAHLNHLLARTAAEHPGRLATRVKRDGEWVTQTWSEFDDRVQRLALAMVAGGVRRGERVAIFAANSPEWSETDFACHRAGAVVVPIYPSSTPEQARHILAGADCRWVFVGGPKEAARVAEARAELPGLARVIAYAAAGDADDYEAVLAGAPDDEGTDAELTARLNQACGCDVATIIYTSGTTGDPKGVALQHRAFRAELDSLDTMFVVTPEDHSLSFLPLSHALERGWTYYVMSHGCATTYCPDPHELPGALVEIRPTLHANVPRFYEMVAKTAREKVAGSRAKRAIFAWAMRVGGRAQRANRKGRRPAPGVRLALPLADRLVFRHIRDAVGGPKTVLACGGAPISIAIEEFFSAAGMQIHTGYGMTEAAPLISFNSPKAFKLGTAGRVMPGGEIKIGADAEILYRGENLMLGYWNDDEATAAAIDADGWLHTGDAGYVDNQGFLVITDRIKDILVTSGGKNIAPQPIEGTLLADPLFEHAVLLGDNRPFVTLLVKPSFPHLEEMAKQLQVTWEKRDELFHNQQIVDEIKRRVQAMTAKLPKQEQIRDLRVLAEDFTQENGLLTPTLKVKRREVEKRFGELIEDMYAKLSGLRHKPDERQARRARTDD